MDECKVGQTVNVGILRGEKEMELRVTLAERSNPEVGFDAE